MYEDKMAKLKALSSGVSKQLEREYQSRVQDQGKFSIREDSSAVAAGFAFRSERQPQRAGFCSRSLYLLAAVLSQTHQHNHY